MEKTTGIDTVLLSIGTATGIANIESILGIIILGVQIAWIGIKLIYKIKEMFDKHTPPEEIDGEVDEYIETLEEIKETIRNGESSNEK